MGLRVRNGYSGILRFSLKFICSHFCIDVTFLCNCVEFMFIVRLGIMRVTISGIESTIPNCVSMWCCCVRSRADL